MSERSHLPARRRLGLVGDAPPGFTPSQYDADLLDRLFGITVEQVDVDTMFGDVAAVTEDAAESEYAAALAAQPTLAEVDASQARTSARITTAMREWRDQESLSGLAIRCWPEFRPSSAPVPARRCPEWPTREHQPLASATCTAP